VRLPDGEVRVPATRLFAPLVAASVPTDKAAMLQLLLLRQHAEIQRLRSVVERCLGQCLKWKSHGSLSYWDRPAGTVTSSSDVPCPRHCIIWLPPAGDAGDSGATFGAATVVDGGGNEDMFGARRLRWLLSRLRRAIALNYPYSIHGLPSPPSWALPDQKGFVHSIYCLGKLDFVTVLNMCGECAKLDGDQKLVAVVRRCWANDLHVSRIGLKWSLRALEIDRGAVILRFFYGPEISQPPRKAVSQVVDPVGGGTPLHPPG
jgi:hypothetical protein